MNFKKNPYPAGWNKGYRSEDVFVRNPNAFGNTTSGNPVDVFKKVFNKKS